MKWFKVFLAFAGLVLGAASARAEPIEVIPIGDPIEEGSWAHDFKVVRGDMTGSPFDKITGYMWSGQSWQTQKDNGDPQDAIDHFEKVGDHHWEPDITSWDQQSNDGTTFVATGTALDPPDSDNGVKFTLHFANGSGGNKPAFTFTLSLYNDGSLVYNQDWTWTGKPGTEKWLHAASAIPEPFSLAFLGSAFAGVVGFQLRNRRKEPRN